MPHKSNQFLILFCGLLSECLPNLAFALGSDSPVGEGLNYVINAMFGGTGMAIATIAIMGVGIACLSHIFPWKYFLYTVAGVAVIFGAPAIVDGIRSLVHR